MTTFDKREEGFEKKFAHDEELRFKANARRNKIVGLWAAEKLLGAQLAQPGRNLTRQSFIAAVNGHSFQTGIYPPVDYSASRFGGTGVHVVKLNCSDANSPYENEANFKTGF